MSLIYSVQILHRCWVILPLYALQTSFLIFLESVIPWPLKWSSSLLHAFSFITIWLGVFESPLKIYLPFYNQIFFFLKYFNVLTRQRQVKSNLTWKPSIFYHQTSHEHQSPSNLTWTLSSLHRTSHEDHPAFIKPHVNIVQPPSNLTWTPSSLRQISYEYCPASITIGIFTNLCSNIRHNSFSLESFKASLRCIISAPHQSESVISKHDTLRMWRHHAFIMVTHSNINFLD